MTTCAHCRAPIGGGQVAVAGGHVHTACAAEIIAALREKQDPYGTVNCTCHWCVTPEITWGDEP